MKTPRRLLRDFAVRHVGGTAVVLVYHRVAELERDPHLLAVTPRNFESHMRMLSESFEVISLADLLTGLRRRRIPKRSVVVTFDDGYADNLTTAEPILVERGVPATVFVSSGHVRAGRMFWWDELERLILSPGVLPERIVIDLPSARFSTVLEDSLSYSQHDAASDRTWNMLAAPTNARQRLYSELCEFILPLSAEEREDALARLRSACGASDLSAESPASSSCRPLSAEEVAELDSSPCVEVGAHTVNHTVLASRTIDEQRREILEDRDALAAICGRPMRVFSYPYGSLDDYSDDTVTIAREAGFDGACSNHLGMVKQWTDRYRLPRDVVHDCSAERLAEQIEVWLDGSF